MTLIPGLLGDSYRRQLRKVTNRPQVDVVVEKAAALAREYGFRPFGVDVGVSQLATTEPAYLDELRARLDESGLLPTVIIGTLVLHTDRDLSEPPLRQAINNLTVAQRLGSPLGLYYFGYGGRVTRAGRLRLAIDQVGRLADAARTLGIAVTTENYDYFTSDDFLALFAALDRPNVGLHNDTGNWLILDEDPVAATRKLAEHTYHAHVRDYVLEAGVYRSVPLGQGLVDFSVLLPDLARLASKRERFVLAIEMDLDDGDVSTEDAAVRECARYLAAWVRKRE